jgi:hypothetical protein
MHEWMNGKVHRKSRVEAWWPSCTRGTTGQYAESGKEVKARLNWVVSQFEFAQKFELSASDAPFGFGLTCASAVCSILSAGVPGA